MSLSQTELVKVCTSQFIYYRLSTKHVACCFFGFQVTPKGLHKLSVSVEACYSNLTRILSSHVLPVCHRLFFHIEQMKGLASWKEYALCSISLETLEGLSRALRSFVLKVLELHQVC